MNFPSKKLQALKSPDLGKSSRGFSLFELVVFIISVAIIYAFAANRFAGFPAQAERANFLAITTQLQSSLNLEVMTVLASGQGEFVTAFEGINPMDLLLQPPFNYLGSFSNPDVASFDWRSWYFDLSREELVYLVNDVGGVFNQIEGLLSPVDEIRFKVRVGRGEVDARTGLDIALAERTGAVPIGGRRNRATGVILEPTTPFFWRDIDEIDELIEPATTVN